MSVKNELDTIKRAMREDYEYAWGWHCNIACAAMDEGIAHVVANRVAARFMNLAFGVDTSSGEPASGDASDEIEMGGERL